MPQIQLFEVTIGGSTKKTPVTYYDAKTYVDINLAAGEHLIEMTMTRGGTVSGITYCAFKTSFDKGYSIGESTGERMTVTSPKGWQIVGFYGEASSAIYGPSTSGKYRYPISKLGVIMAPIL